MLQESDLHTLTWTLPMPKPPLTTFTPFHPSRVPALRLWREKALAEGASATKEKSTRVLAGELKPKPKPRSKSKPNPLAALIPSQLSPELQAQIRQALESRSKKRS